ncbi:MAG: hypothetical protein PHW60_15640 [Kiritimatiellae bacterium]|nr:hypothetical protein [Kiritimatiellia bacterium]
MKSIRWSFPLLRTHTGIAMGNGNFGALVWGRARLHITINRSDCWDHRHEQHLLEGMTYAAMQSAFATGGGQRLGDVTGQGMTCWPAGPTRQPADTFIPGPLRKKVLPGDYTPSRLPMGRFELILKAGHVPWRGELQSATGQVVITIRARSGRAAGAVRLRMHPEHPVLIVHDPSRLIRSVVARPAWEWLSGWFKSRQFQRPRRVRQPGITGWAQACPADPAMAALCRRDKDCFWIAMERGPNAVAALDAARTLLAMCRKNGRKNLLAASDRWWRAFWRRAPMLRLPEPFFNDFFVYALYKFGCATNPLGGVPAGLQGPWIEEYQPPPWGGDYHFNINIQQIYMLAFGSGRTEHLLPLFDMLESWRDTMRHNARVLLGIEDGLLMGMLTTDRGRLLYYGAGCVLDPTVSGWTAQLFWLYYRHTGDLDFLRKRAYPFMAGVMRTFTAMLEEKDGRLSLPLAVSPEFANEQGQRLGRDPSVQLACIHMLAEALGEACRRLGIKPHPAWEKVRQRLPLFTLTGEKGQERIAVWQGQDLTMCHRHHAHLSCIYPFDSLGQLTPATQHILDNSLDHWVLKGMGLWSEWCLPWAAIIQARMGFSEAPMVLMRLWKEVFVNEGLATVYLPKFRGITAHRRADLIKPRETNEVMQLDGTMGGATALMECLAHQHGDVVHVFPAVPAEWRNVSFKNIRLPGPCLVSAEKKDGVVRSVQIQSLGGGPLKLVVHGATRMRCVGRGLRKRGVTFPATLTFQPSERMDLVAGPAP